jgi:soluble lytic murein transglycosylase-like protein
MRVASCETGGTFNPRAVGRAGERGLFQIHPVHFGRLDERRLFERRYNARVAYRMSRGGRDWSPWTCQP